MKPKLFLTFITAGLIAGLSSGCIPIPDNKVSFACDEHLNSIDNEFTYATVASRSQNRRAIVHWDTEDFSESGYTPQKRCQKVSPRFQQAYDNGSLKYLTYGTMNEQPVICTALKAGEDCDMLIMTLRHSDNAEDQLTHLTSVLRGGASSNLIHEADITEVGGRKYFAVDIQHFLSKPAPENENL